MREYIALKKFHLGEITKDIFKDERIQFDGTNAIIRGEKVRAPSLMRVVGTHIQEAFVDANGKLLEQTMPVNIETPQQRAERLKKERLHQLRGSAGSGQFLDDTDMKSKDKVLPRNVAKEGPQKDEILKDQDAKSVKTIERSDIEVKTGAGERAIKKTAEAAKNEKKTHSKEVIHETEGTEVGKIKDFSINGAKAKIIEDEDPKSFYQAMLDGTPKKLDVDKDQFVTNSKRPVIHLDSQDEAVEVKRLVNGDFVTPSKDPLKEWSSMTVRKKETFIKKLTDISVIKQVISRETGTVKRKAEERLATLDGGKRV